MSPRMCFEFMTQYAPPYALRVMTVIFGTVASAYAKISFAPCRMMPLYSWSVPVCHHSNISQLSHPTFTCEAFAITSCHVNKSNASSINYHYLSSCFICHTTASAQCLRLSKCFFIHVLSALYSLLTACEAGIVRAELMQVRRPSYCQTNTSRECKHAHLPSQITACTQYVQ